MRYVLHSCQQLHYASQLEFMVFMNVDAKEKAKQRSFYRHSSEVEVLLKVVKSLLRGRPLKKKTLL